MLDKLVKTVVNPWLRALILEGKFYVVSCLSFIGYDTDEYSRTCARSFNERTLYNLKLLMNNRMI